MTAKKNEGCVDEKDIGCPQSLFEALVVVALDCRHE